MTTDSPPPSSQGENPPPVSMQAAADWAAAETALDVMLHEGHLARAADLPVLVRNHAVALGCLDTTIYLADLQQRLLVPFCTDEPGRPSNLASLSVESTLAGRAFQHIKVLSQAAENDDASVPGASILWLPLLDGTERLGLLAVTVADAAPLEPDGPLARRLRRLAAVTAELVMTKTLYGDTIVRLRRTAPMELAAEIQWSLLPPLTFASNEVTIAAGLEPAYQVAGDSVDYAVDQGVARLAVFDGMGHGLASAQLVSLVVNAYRNARRSGLSLVDTVRQIDDAVTEIFAGASFCTGVLAELDTATGELRWASAGHPEPLLLRDGRLVRPLATRPVLPFGLAFDLTGAQRGATVGVEHLQPGDLVLLYTDGIPEARAPDGAFFGVDRLVELVTRNLAAGLPAPETLRRVIHALLLHQGHALDDDASLLMVHWRSETETRLLPHP